MYVLVCVTFSSDVETNEQSLAQTMLERLRKLLCALTGGRVRRGLGWGWGLGGGGWGFKTGIFGGGCKSENSRGQNGIRV